MHVRCFKILKQKYQNLTLTVSGDGLELGNIKKYITSESINDVELTGFVSGEKKTEIFKKADIYIFPTYYIEGMPNSVLEAMAFGLPVITRPVGGIPDFFENGKMGFITDSLESDTYASLLEKMILNRKKIKEISIYNYRFAHNNFISNIVADRINKIFETHLG